jgi:tetratricopeptide (TPR) repeat protein
MRVSGIVVAIVALAVGGSAAAERFQERFDAAAASGDDAQVDQLLDAWKKAEPNDAQAYVAAAHYYFARAQQAGLAPSDIEGKALGRASSELREATRKFPVRLDIRFELAEVYQRLGDFEAQYGVLADAFKYAKSHPAELRWREGAPLPDAPDKFIPGAVQGYIHYYYNRATPEDDERFLRLAKLVAEAYPKHPYPVNSIGLYYASKQRWREALPYLEKAHALDPSDAFVMMNLAALYTQLYDDAKAKLYYEKVVASKADETIRAEARAKLAAMQ